MIIESALMTITAGQEESFLAALESAKAVLRQSPGFLSVTVQRGIERPDTFLLLIGWETLQAHTEGFRGGPLFAQWRELIGPFFAGPPTVEHWAPQE
ncbi:MAG: antibiotic biosynthesis monooxygenase family protein [Candidatus Nanopelagicales bacterium]